MEKGSKAPLSAVKRFLGEENGDLSCLLERNHNLFLREIVAVWESYKAVYFRLLCPFFLTAHLWQPAVIMYVSRRTVDMRREPWIFCVCVWRGEGGEGGKGG